MGFIDITKPLSTFLSSAFNKSQEHQEKNSWERKESNSELLASILPLCFAASPIQQYLSFLSVTMKYKYTRTMVVVVV